MKKHKIEKLYAFLTVNSEGEGVCAFRDAATNTWIPLIGSDKTRVDSYLSIAQDIANQTNETIKLYEFSNKTYKHTIGPENKTSKH